MSSIPKGSVISSAKLDLTVGVSTADDHWAQMGYITKSWDNTTTWNSPWSKAGGDYTELSYHIEFVKPVTNRQEGMKETWDVKTEVNKWVQGTMPNYGLMRFGNIEQYYHDNTAVQAKRPKLTVVYTTNGTGAVDRPIARQVGKVARGMGSAVYGVDGRKWNAALLVRDRMRSVTVERVR